MDAGDLSRIFLAFVTVIGFIGAAALIVRKTGLASGAIALAKNRRLHLVETLPLDARRRAVILRCDGREHLILLGQNGETVVDADISEIDSPINCEAKDTPRKSTQTFSILKKGTTPYAPDTADAA